MTANHRLSRDGSLHGTFVGLVSAHDGPSVESPTHPVALVRKLDGTVVAWHAESAAEQHEPSNQRPRRGQPVDVFAHDGGSRVLVRRPDDLYGEHADLTAPGMRPVDPDEHMFTEAEYRLAERETPTDLAGHAVDAPSASAVELARQVYRLSHGEDPPGATQTVGQQIAAARAAKADLARPLPSSGRQQQPGGQRRVVELSASQYRAQLNLAAAQSHTDLIENMLTPPGKSEVQQLIDLATELDRQRFGRGGEIVT